MLLETPRRQRLSNNFFFCGPAYIAYGVVDHFEGRLLVVVVDAAVAVQDGHALVLGPFTVAAVHAVVRPIVPLAREDEETLWNAVRGGKIRNRSAFNEQVRRRRDLDFYQIGCGASSRYEHTSSHKLTTSL